MRYLKQIFIALFILGLFIVSYKAFGETESTITILEKEYSLTDYTKLKTELIEKVSTKNMNYDDARNWITVFNNECSKIDLLVEATLAETDVGVESALITLMFDLFDITQDNLTEKLNNYLAKGCK